MKHLTWFLLALLTAVPLCAKPKVDVRVKVNEGVTRDRAGESLSKGGITSSRGISPVSGAGSPANTFTFTIWYLNVTVMADDSEAVAKNTGQWCIKGDASFDVAFDFRGEYQGTLDGNNLDLEVPAKNGKTKKLHFEVLDHKWRKLSDL